MSDPSPNTCFGCIHLGYAGPQGTLPEDEIDEDAGRYECRLTGHVMPATAVPRPRFTGFDAATNKLVFTCKETR